MVLASGGILQINNPSSRQYHVTFDVISTAHICDLVCLKTSFMKRLEITHLDH